LVHDNKLMIADLGLSKQLSIEVASSSVVCGMPAYVEPQCYKNENYKRNKKSDIYSLGVLFWEISSGSPPFSGIPPHALIYKITNLVREQPIIDTPPSYVNLYQKCRDDDPNSRPTIDDVYDILTILASQFSTNDNINSETNPDLTNQGNSQPQSTYNDSIYNLCLPQTLQIGKYCIYFVLIYLFKIY
jgi:serine/threonine protein kinase